MATGWAPGAPPRAIAVGIVVAATASAAVAVATLGTPPAVACTIFEAVVAAACALAWRARAGASWTLGLGAVAWSVAALLTVLLPARDASDALAHTATWPMVLTTFVLVAGTIGFAGLRRRDALGVSVDAMAAGIAIAWLLANVRPHPGAEWGTGYAVVVGAGALATALALALVAHVTGTGTRTVAAGTTAVAATAAAFAAVRPETVPAWWVVPTALGFVAVGIGALLTASRPPGPRHRPAVWLQQVPIVPAALAVGVAFVHPGITARDRWSLVAVIVVALARQTFVSARGSARVRHLEQTLGSFRHGAEHDPLTGLANRALFHERVDRALEQPRRRSFAVLFIDLDDFKTINDTLGHGAGDELLIAVAQRLRASVRAEDTVARLGGDEFGVLLNGLEGYEDAQRSAARLLEALQPPFEVEGAALRVGTSLGLAPFGPRSTTSQLLREADMALYAAKDRGKNQFRVFSWTMQRDARDRFELQAELRQAIEREELLIYYQPIVDAASGQLAGFEALTRWKHSTRGVLLPDRFIPLAEELGVIHALGLVVLRAACAQLKAWDEQYPDAPRWHVAVNVSVQQFDSPDLLTDVTEVLRESGIDPSRVVLEVTESSMMDDPEHVLHLLQQLRALGVRVAIDDFGTGYSALQYLQQFPLDVLKIDKAFVADIESGPANATLLRAMLELGRSLGLGTVVEGVESHGQLAVVRDLGCDYVQGYLLGTPGAAREIAGVLRQAAERDWTLMRSGPVPPTPAPVHHR